MHLRVKVGAAFCLFAGAAAVCGGRPAGAAIIYDSGGFEGPRFTAGSALEGQDAPPAGQGPWERIGGTANSAVVQTAVVRSGSQAVRVDRPGQDVFLGVLKATPAVSGQITVEWDMNVSAATHAGNFGPFFGVQAYDELNSAPLLTGAAGVDARTGEVLYQEAGTGNLVAGPVVEFGAWHRFQLILDYNTDTYSVRVNGQTVVSGEGFVDDSAASEIDDFTDAPLVALAAGNSSAELAAAGTAYFDNYRVVPEPGVLSVLGGAAGLGLLRRRPRRS